MYTSKDVSALSDLKAIRERPGMYIGSTENPKQLFIEALDNALDEIQAGYSEYAEVTLDLRTNKYTVRDYGRGIPIGESEYTDSITGDTHKVETLQLVFQKTHSGSKFGSNDSYKKSRGMHGVGLKCINALSESTYAQTFRGGKSVSISLSRGEILDLSKSTTKEPDGTLIEFIPDKEIFDSLELSESDFENILGIPMAFGLKLKVTVIDKKGEEVDLSGKLNYNNIYDLFDCESKGVSTLLKESFEYTNKETSESILLALKYTSTTSAKSKGYTNMIYNPMGGSHVRYFESIYKKAWEKYLTDKFRIDDIFVGLRAIVGIFINNKEMAFSSQTKERLTTNKRYFSQFDEMINILQNYLETHEEIRNALIKRFEQYRESQTKLSATKELSDLVYVEEVKDNSSSKKSVRRRSSVVKKLVECTKKSKDSTKLIIVEGQSACGTLIKARDIETQALLPIRGKILNVSKNIQSKSGVKTFVNCMRNEEVASIVNASGTGIGNDCDYSRSRYEDYWIFTDSDEDGKNIACLLTSIFVNLLPDIVRQGHLFIVKAPLYGWIDKGHHYYTNDLSEVGNLNTLTRYKGLGEMDSEDMRDACLKDENQNLIQLDYPNDLNSFNEAMTSASKRYQILESLGLIKYTKVGGIYE